MPQFRISKYDPANRNPDGTHKDLNEWTSFNDVGTLVTKDKYEVIEKAYIDTVIQIFKFCNVNSFEISGLKDHLEQNLFNEGDVVDLNRLKKVMKAVLREEFWCRLKNNRSYIHFDSGYNMYVGAPDVPEFITKRINKRSLFIESFKSPHNK